ncbi:MAG: type II toxin-antitoxin system Phd/YefM family antitoxin [Acidobacteriota bacterium]
MATRTVSATEFKAKCLALIDEVNASGDVLTITKRGQPVAVLGPTKKARRKEPAGGP